MPEESNVDAVALATELTVAWLSNPNTRTSADEVPNFLQLMHSTVEKLSTPAPEPAPSSNGSADEHTPAVSVRKSLASRDHIISMIDGKKYRTLTRHLRTNGLTPAEYRRRYGLKPDYPMVAPSYSEARSVAAKARGLGRKAGEKVTKAADEAGETAAKAVKKTRRSAKAALEAARSALGTDS